MHLKVFVKLEKTLKTLSSGQKTQKTQKTQKKPKKPTGLGYFKKNPGFFPTLKEKHGVWDPMPELTISSPHFHSRVDSNTFAMGIG